VTRVFEKLWATVALVLIISGCGSARLAPGPAARVNGQTITWQDVRSNVSYAAGYYAPATSTTRCSKSSTSTFCTALTRQVLERLIEERVIEIYASRHDIVLTPLQRRRAKQMTMALLARMTVAGTNHNDPRRRMLGPIIRRELLIQQVQAAVTSSLPSSGPSYHLRRYLVPTFGSAHQTYRAASQLAADNSPPPPGTIIRTEWKANFRLSRTLRASLRPARRGEYAGPFKRAGGYEVIEVLDRSQHRYGAKAREFLVARRFAAWLRGQVSSAHLVCYSPGGLTTPCPHP
jgi:hypothetical protein